MVIAYYICINLFSSLFFLSCLYSETIMKLCTNVARDNFISLGTCIGKFTKTKKFKMHITALDLIAPLAKVKSLIVQSVFCVVQVYFCAC